MSKKEFVTGTPQPLGHRRQTVNQSDDAEMEKAFEMLAEKVTAQVLLAVTEAVAEQLKAAGIESKAPTINGSNGRKMPVKDDEFDTLPPGDQWQDYNMNDAITGRNDRKPGHLDEYDFPDELRGDLPTD